MAQRTGAVLTLCAVVAHLPPVAQGSIHSGALPENASVRSETLLVPYVANVTVEVPLAKEGPRLPASVVTALTTFLALAMCISFGFVSYFCGPLALRDWDDHEVSNCNMLAEAVLALVLPWLSAAVGLLWVVSAHSGPPPWFFAVVVPLILRAGFHDFQRPDARLRYFVSCGHLPALQWLVEQLGLAGLLACALFGATVVQALVTAAAAKGGGLIGSVVMADIAGWGATALKMNARNSLEGERHRHRNQVREGERIDLMARKLSLLLGRVMWEAGPQLLLQTSVLMASGKSLVGQPVVLASVLFSMMTMLKHVVTTACSLPVFLDGNYDCGGVFSAMFMVGLPVVGLLGVIALSITKLAMIEACPDRLWGLSTGCVEL